MTNSSPHSRVWIKSALKLFDDSKIGLIRTALVLFRLGQPPLFQWVQISDCADREKTIEFETNERRN